MWNQKCLKSKALDMSREKKLDQLGHRPARAVLAALLFRVGHCGLTKFPWPVTEIHSALALSLLVRDQIFEFLMSMVMSSHS